MTNHLLSVGTMVIELRNDKKKNLVPCPVLRISNTLSRMHRCEAQVITYVAMWGVRV